MQQPEQYLAVKKAKSLTVEMRTYVNWVDLHVSISEDKEVKRKFKASEGDAPPNMSTCIHDTVHHMGQQCKIQLKIVARNLQS